MRQAILAFLLLMAAAMSATAKNVVVNNPICEGMNTGAMEISKVEISDDATILDIHVRFHPKYWIKIASTSILEADGKKYALISGEGITPGVEFWMPDSGEADFKLIFQPMPKSTERFDYIEGNEDGAWKLWGIDLTGKTDTGYPCGLPEALKAAPKDGPLPAPIFESGKTKINIHLLADKRAFECEYNLYFDSMLGTQVEMPLKFDSNGVATVEFEQDGSGYAFVQSNSHGLTSFWIAPDDDMDVYIDGRIIGYITKLHNSGSAQANRNPNGYAYFTGHYADLNRIYNTYRYDADEQVFDQGSKLTYDMTGDEYMAALTRYYTDAVKAANEQSVPQMMKELNIATYQQGAIDAFCNLDRLRYVYDKETESGKELPTDSLRVKLTEKHAKQLASLFDCNSPSLLMGWDGYGLELGKGDSKPEALYAESQLIKRLHTAAECTQEAQAARLALTQEDKELLGEFFTNALERINLKTISQLEKMNTLTQPTPDVQLDKLFETIIAPHKGKVVVVDFWDTWCRPCRMAIKENEPHKATDLSSPDIVWIYLADESSPIEKYMQMIPEIKGLHYRLTDEQMNQLTYKDFPEIDGIPAYVFVNRDGTYSLRLDFRDHNVMTSTILKEINNK